MTHNPEHHILSRTVRFSINTDGSTKGSDSTAGKPSMTTLGRYYELTLSVLGRPDPTTGYLLGIQEIDALTRTHLVPLITNEIQTNPTQHPANLMSDLWSAATDHLDRPTLEALRWHLTPYHSIEMTRSDPNSILIRQLYEFAAAHRLHTPELSDEENAKFFGKCNNPTGHGHNYKVEPTIRVPLNLINNPDLHLKIESAVNNSIIDPLDHKFLNKDCPPFDQSTNGAIPSVENITTHCYNTLAPAIQQLGCVLETITVWETDRTSATYPA